jgi:CelD/BcsL family acetyltransferase involved in cellulose biosynthesis
MRIDMYTDFDLLPDIEHLWQKLLERGTSDPIFGSFLWAKHWWECFGQEKHQLRLITLSLADEVAGLAGLCLTQENWGPLKAKVLVPLGWSTAEYVDLLLPSDSKKATDLLFDFLIEAQDWDVLSLKRLPAMSPTRDNIKSAAAEKKLLVLEELEEVCPFIALNGTFESLMHKHFKSNFRKEIRRNTRRLNSMGHHRFEMVTNPPDLDGLLSILVDLEKRSWKGQRGIGIFNTPAKRHFFHQISQTLAAQGKLAIFLQWLDDRLLSYDFGFITNKRIYLYNAAYDPNFKKYSPGTLSQHELLRWCYDMSLSIFDFLRGGERYKALWTDVATQNINLHIFSPALKGRVLSSGLAGRLALRRLKRQIRPPYNEALFRIGRGEIR